MERGKTWRGYPALSVNPSTIMGVERRWFLSERHVGPCHVERHQLHCDRGSHFSGVLYGVGFWAWKQDPNMLEILRASAKIPRPLRSGQVGRFSLDDPDSEIARERKQRTHGLRSGGDRWPRNCPGGAGSKMGKRA